MKLKTIIIDDEAMARTSLREDLVLHCPDVQIVGEADSVQSAISLLGAKEADLVFLDIQMGDGTGFDVLEAIAHRPSCSIVFTTAYDHYAIKAFRYAASDYLLKPINANDLMAAVERVRAGHDGQQEALQRLLANLRLPSHQHRIAIPTSEGIHVLNTSDVIRCQADSNYTHIYLCSGEKLLAAKTLKDLEELLNSPDFERVHTSHLINLAHLRRYVARDGGMLIMTDASEVPVSQRKKAQLLELIKNIR